MATTTKSAKRATKRRGRGEGSIFQRADGRWAGTVTLGYDGTGKRRRKTEYGRTKEEVQEKLTRLMGQKLDGNLGTATGTTLGDYLDHWLEHVAKPTIRPQTYPNYEKRNRLYIKPYLGGVKLAKLSIMQIRAWMRALETDGKSTSIRSRVHAHLKQILRSAVDDGLIRVNPMANMRRPKHEDNKVRSMTQEQVKDFLKAALRERLYAFFVLCFSTGLRVGEALALRWEDVNLTERTLTVRGTVVWLQGKGLSVGETKTANSRRRISIPMMAAEALRNHRAQSMREGLAGSPLVFPNTKGELLWRGNIYGCVWKRVLEDACLPHFRLHDMRHTFATLSLQGGTNVKVVSEMLGHKDIALTLRVYSHVFDEMLDQAADTMDRMLA